MLIFLGFGEEHINFFVRLTGRLSWCQPDPHQSKKVYVYVPFSLPIPAFFRLLPELNVIDSQATAQECGVREVQGEQKHLLQINNEFRQIGCLRLRIRENSVSSLQPVTSFVCARAKTNSPSLPPNSPRVVADVWEKDVWEFQAKSGSSGSCRLFLHFRGKITVQEKSGKTLGSPRRPSSRQPRPSDSYQQYSSLVQERKRHINLRKSSGHRPDVPGHPAGQKGVCRPVSQLFATGSSAGTPAACPRDTGEFQVTVCGVTVCSFSRHKGNQRPKCL